MGILNGINTTKAGWNSKQNISSNPTKSSSIKLTNQNVTMQAINTPISVLSLNIFSSPTSIISDPIVAQYPNCAKAQVSAACNSYDNSFTPSTIASVEGGSGRAEIPTASLYDNPLETLNPDKTDMDTDQMVGLQKINDKNGADYITKSNLTQGLSHDSTIYQTGYLSNKNKVMPEYWFTLDDGSDGWVDDAQDAIKRAAIKGAKVIVLNWTSSYDTDSSIQAGITFAKSLGAIVIAAVKPGEMETANYSGVVKVSNVAGTADFLESSTAPLEAATTLAGKLGVLASQHPELTGEELISEAKTRLINGVLTFENTQPPVIEVVATNKDTNSFSLEFNSFEPDDLTNAITNTQLQIKSTAASILGTVTKEVLANGHISYTVAGLASDTNYTYELTTLDNDKQRTTVTGTFTTDTTPPPSDPVPPPPPTPPTPDTVPPPENPVIPVSLPKNPILTPLLTKQGLAFEITKSADIKSDSKLQIRVIEKNGIPLSEKIDVLNNANAYIILSPLNYDFIKNKDIYYFELLVDNKHHPLTVSGAKHEITKYALNPDKAQNYVVPTNSTNTTRGLQTMSITATYTPFPTSTNNQGKATLPTCAAPTRVGSSSAQLSTVKPATFVAPSFSTSSSSQPPAIPGLENKVIPLANSKEYVEKNISGTESFQNYLLHKQPDNGNTFNSPTSQTAQFEFSSTDILAGEATKYNLAGNLFTINNLNLDLGGNYTQYPDIIQTRQNPTNGQIEELGTYNGSELGVSSKLTASFDALRLGVIGDLNYSTFEADNSNLSYNISAGASNLFKIDANGSSLLLGAKADNLLSSNIAAPRFTLTGKYTQNLDDNSSYSLEGISNGSLNGYYQMSFPNSGVTLYANGGYNVGNGQLSYGAGIKFQGLAVEYNSINDPYLPAKQSLGLKFFF